MYILLLIMWNVKRRILRVSVRLWGAKAPLQLVLSTDSLVGNVFPLPTMVD